MQAEIAATDGWPLAAVLLYS
ncbi:hypothetical protein SBDP1_1290017 [Syntrophobacter sp. SbD1]|nr:hypothetical protein SBDP1_1290017 [Syntrophobacter sp. SbD1]